MIRAIAKMGWSRDEVVVVTGIGCSARSNAIIRFQYFPDDPPVVLLDLLQDLNWHVPELK